MVKVLKATISGSFIAGDKQTESYGKVEGFLPLLDDDKATQMIVKRYAKIWIGAALKEDGSAIYKRIQRVREVFIDNIEVVETDDQFSYIGRSIMDMNYEELQDLAAAKDLSGIPLYKEGSLANQRRVAFAEYGGKILGITMEATKHGKKVMVPLDHRLEGFSPSNYAPIIVEDGDTVRQNDVRVTIEESIDREALALSEGKKEAIASEPSRLSIEQLKKIADTKKIKYSAKISYGALYKLLYPDQAA